MIQTITNLYPYPAQPTRGLFNLQLFRELAKITEVHNTVLVANSNPLRTSSIRNWTSPPDVPAATYLPYQHIPIIGRNTAWRLIAHALTSHRPLPTSHFPPPTALLSSWLYPDGTAAAHAFRDTHIPAWTMVLGTDRFHLSNPQRRKAMLRADQHTAGYICVSQNIADDLKADGIPEDKIHVILNGVDTTRFHPIPSDEALSQLPPQLSALSPQPFPYLVFIGNLIPIKAPDITLKAFATYLSQSVARRCTAQPAQMAGMPTSHSPQPPSAPRLVFIGDGPMRPSLETMAAELGIQDEVHFLGRRAHAEIPLWLNAADCLLLSSQSEGMPNAVAEALACECPVVATDVGACAEMLASQPCCRTVPVGTPQAMGHAIDDVLEEAAQKQERPTFTRTWADMAREILTLMERL